MMRDSDRGRTGKTEKWILGILLGLIIIGFAYLGYKVLGSDYMPVTQIPGSESSKVSVDITDGDSIGDSKNHMISFSDDPDDDRECIEGTAEFRLTNNKYYGIKDWALEIDIDQECYLSGFSGCQVEVHQYRNGQELSETLKGTGLYLTDSCLDQNEYADFEMIRLMRGDMIILRPVSGSGVISDGDTAQMSAYMYYWGDLDLDDYKLVYSNDLKVTDEGLFYLLIVLLALWIVIFLVFLISAVIYRNTQKEYSERLTTITSMVDIYSAAFMINVAKNTCRTIKKNDALMLNFEEENIQEQINRVNEEFCPELYRQGLSEFLDLSTLKERMGDHRSIIYEFQSSNIGWCSLRFMRVYGVKNEDLFIMTVQNMNEEKERIDLIQRMVDLAEYERVVLRGFMDAVENAIDSKMVDVIEANSIVRDSNGDDVQTMADAASTADARLKHVRLLQKSLFDFYKIENSRLETRNERYNLTEMTEELCFILKDEFEGRGFEFRTDVDRRISCDLIGDRYRIMQVLMILLVSAFNVTEQGFVKLSVFGKRVGDKEELIFSVRDTGPGISKAALEAINGFLDGSKQKASANPSLGYLKTVHGILKAMGSEMKIVSVPGDGSEFFFTLEQAVAEDGEVEDGL